MEHDDFTQVSNRAKFLVKDHAAKYPTAAVRLRTSLPELKRKSNRKIFAAPLSLSDAQRVIATEYGFGSWRQLRQFIRINPATDGFLATPGAMPPALAALVEAVDAGDAPRVEQLIKENPSLVHARVASDITCGDTLLHRADPRASYGRRMTPGHLKVAQQLIDGGVDINAMGGSGDSCFTPPLDASTWIGNRKMVALLLENGADPDRSYWTMTKPVRTAANHRGQVTFRMLLKAGAAYTLYETVALGYLKLTRELLERHPERVNEPSDGQLPIVQAAQDVKMTRLLLKYGADPNGRDERGVTALMAASQAGKKEVAATLLEGGAEVDIFSAISSRDSETVARMLDSDPACHKSEFVTPVILAARTGDKEILERLLQAGADPNEVRYEWMQDRPLTTAAAHRFDELIPVLLKHGAEVNPVEKRTYWSLPLIAAVRWGNYRAVELLLEAGADASLTSDKTQIGIPLGWAGYVGDLLAAGMLLDAGANKLARAQALCSAARHGRVALIELFGTLDTDLSYAHSPDGTALQHAKKYKQPQAVELLTELLEIHALPKTQRNDILKPRADFLRHLLNDDGKALDALIKQQPDLVDRDLVRNELFHHTTANLQTKRDLRPLRSVAHVLLKHGVPWTIQSAIACDRLAEAERLVTQPGIPNQGLHTAAKFNNVPALSLMLRAGANIESKESWGTALHEAARYASLEVIQQLLEEGANVNATDQYGNTPRVFCRPDNPRLEAICDLLDAQGAKS